MLAWLAPFVLWLLGFAILLGVLGSLKETLRNAEDLSCRLSACEGQLVGVVQEWTDVLDKLLAREEREDFRPRLERTLRDPAQAWPPLDPEGDVARFKDIDGDPRAFLAEFARLREENLAWLHALGPLDALAWLNGR